MFVSQQDSMLFEDFKCPECQIKMDLIIKCSYSQPRGSVKKPIGNIKVTKITKRL